MKTRILTNPLEKAVLFTVLFVSAIMLFAYSSNTALAFSADSASVIRMSNDTWVYINQAEYGNQESEVLVPIASVPNWLPRTQGNYLKYQVQVDGRTVVGLDTSSMVLSDATISGNQYLVPAGEKRMFTLMTFITVPTTELISPETSVSLSITDLPLTIRTKFNLSL